MRTGRILHYDILERLGAGAMGEVYLAEDTRLGRRVVLKFLVLPERDGATERGQVEREARSLAALSHPHIARVLALETAADPAFLVMEYIDGETLAEVLSLGPLAPPEVAHIGASIAGALAHAHGRGVVHRDIKPENILITEDGHVRLADFGIASLQGGTPESDGIVWGTPEYMSPEQARGEPADGRSDQYALGVVLIEALTGKPPLPEGEPADRLARHQVADDATLAREPTVLERALRRCVEHDPARRYPDASALHAELSRIARQLDGTPRPRPRRLKLLIIAAAVGAVGVLVAGALALRSALPPAGHHGPPRTVVVAPIAVRGGRASDTYVGRAFAEAVVMGLSRAADLRVQMIGDTVPGAGTARAELRVEGGIVRTGGRNHARLTVTDVPTRRVIWEGARDAEDPQLPFLARGFADDIARALHVPIRPRYDYFLYAIHSPALGRSPVASAALGALRRDDLDAGRRWTRELVEHFPREAEAHVLFAYTLLGPVGSADPDAEGRRELEAELARLRELDPEDPWPTVFEAWLLHRDGRVAEAEERFRHVLERDDLTAAARGFVLSLRGQARCELDQLTAALADLDEASRLDPTNTLTLVSCADALGLAGHAEEGLVRARQAIALDPDASRATAAMYRCLARLGRWTEAIPYAELACHRTPDAVTLAYTALILRHAGRAREAEAQLRLAESAPRSAPGDVQLARYHAYAGDRDRALALLRSAARGGGRETEIQHAPEFEPYRADPGFRALLASPRERGVPGAAPHGVMD